MDSDTQVILDITRRTCALLGDSEDCVLPWRTLVEKLNDSQIITILLTCTAKELTSIAYYAIALNRYKFIRCWWQRQDLPQLTPSDLLNAITALQLYRLKIIKTNPIQILLAIVRSRTMRKLYSQLLNWEQINNYYGNDNYYTIDNLQSELRLRLFLVEIATALPNGTKLLWSEWKRYSYPIKIVWNFWIPYRHDPDDADYIKKTFHIFYNNRNSLTVLTPLQQICRWGNVQDQRIALKNLLWWTCDTLIITSLKKNKNQCVLKYFRDTLKAIKQVCNLFPVPINKLIWNKVFYENRDIFSHLI